MEICKILVSPGRDDLNTRTKKNVDNPRTEHREIDQMTGPRFDQTIMLRGISSSCSYPQAFRKIRYYSKEYACLLTFLTNNFFLPALTMKPAPRRAPGLDVDGIPE